MHLQPTTSSFWAVRLGAGRRNFCSSLLPRVSRLSRFGSPTTRGHPCGCCARSGLSAGTSSWTLTSSERPSVPHCCKVRCASRGYFERHVSAWTFFEIRGCASARGSRSRCSRVFSIGTQCTSTREKASDYHALPTTCAMSSAKSSCRFSGVSVRSTGMRGKSARREREEGKGEREKGAWIGEAIKQRRQEK